MTSGIRVGTPAITTRGFKEAESEKLGHWFCDVLDNLNDRPAIEAVKQEVLRICAEFPVYEVNASSQDRAVASGTG